MKVLERTFIPKRDSSTRRRNLLDSEKGRELQFTSNQKSLVSNPGKKTMKAVFFLLFLLFSGLLQPVSASEVLQAGEEAEGNASITELYSDLESFDISVYSERPERNLSLEALLVRKEGGEEEALAGKTFKVDSLPARTRAIRVGFWNVSVKKDGAYVLKARLLQKGEQISGAEYEFVYGRRSIPKFRVNDLLANSEGISVVLSPNEPALFDIEYMLVDGAKVVYITKTEKAVLTEFSEPFVTSWGTLLENNKEYLGRVKLEVYSPKKEFIAYTRAFTAKDDAEITDIFEDESGASATVYGRSQVPFEGYLNFTVFGFGEGAAVIESVRTGVPILLTDDDETVEVSWSRRLPGGVYRLEIELVGNDGDLIERRETIIESDLSSYGSAAFSSGETEAENAENAENTETADEKESTPGFSGLGGLVASLAVVLILSGRKKR
ncbi:MAG: hypothetical protein PHW56_09655 [Methanosarcinaceae archaeon]|nr:hypothetical protein [Methanosarcinaceae archaeon]